MDRTVGRSVVIDLMLALLARSFWKKSCRMLTISITSISLHILPFTHTLSPSRLEISLRGGLC